MQSISSWNLGVFLKSRPILIASLLLTAHWPLLTHEALPQTKDAVTKAQPEGSGEGWVLETDEEMFPLAGSSGVHFHKARADILNGSLASAQQELRKGTTYLLMELRRATEKGKSALHASIRELQHLAAVVGKEQSNYYALQNSGFEHILGRSDLSLAKHHLLKAEEAWNQKQPRATGQHLNAAVLHLRHAWAWLDENVTAAARRVMKEEGRAGLALTQADLIQADGVSQALVKGTGSTDQSVKSGLENIGKEIDALEKREQAMGSRQ